MLVTKLTDVLNANTGSTLPAPEVERQIPLHALQRVKRDKAGDAEDEHRHRIAVPRLLRGLINPAAPTDKAFDRTQQRAQKRPFTGKDARHLAAKRPRDADDDHAK